MNPFEKTLYMIDLTPENYFDLEICFKFIFSSKKILKNTFSFPDFSSRDSVCGSECGKCTSHRDFKGLPPGLKMPAYKIFISLK